MPLFALDLTESSTVHRLDRSLLPHLMVLRSRAAARNWAEQADFGGVHNPGLVFGSAGTR